MGATRRQGYAAGWTVGASTVQCRNVRGSRIPWGSVIQRKSDAGTLPDLAVVHLRPAYLGPSGRKEAEHPLPTPYGASPTGCPRWLSTVATSREDGPRRVRTRREAGAAPEDGPKQWSGGEPQPEEEGARLSQEAGQAHCRPRRTCLPCGFLHFLFLAHCGSSSSYPAPGA